MPNVRLYALFLKIDGKWVRQSEYAYPKAKAVRVFQNWLLSYSMAGKCPALRPVTKEFEKLGR